jgi:hypothetical protein
VGNMFGEYHSSCMLKMSFVDFEKEKADCTRYIAVNVFVLYIFSCSDISLFVGFCILFVFIVNCIPTRANNDRENTTQGLSKINPTINSGDLEG